MFTIQDIIVTIDDAKMDFFSIDLPQTCNRSSQLLTIVNKTAPLNGDPPAQNQFLIIEFTKDPTVYDTE